MKTNFGICRQAYIPMRAAPSEKSEQISQVLFGELFTVLETNVSTNFSLIKLEFDRYSGWIDTKTLTYLDEKDFKQRKQRKTSILKNAFIYLENESNESARMLIGAGSTFYDNERKISLLKHTYNVPESIFEINSQDVRKELHQSSLRLLNTPYLWGGRSSFGLDCSGFVQNIFKQTGIAIRRDTAEQATKGQTINFFHETQTGDLAFFDDEESIIKHVGIILEGNRIIHASGRVKIDKLDHQGIFSEELGKYTHKLRLIKKIIED